MCGSTSETKLPRPWRRKRSLISCRVESEQEIWTEANERSYFGNDVGADCPGLPVVSAHHHFQMDEAIKQRSDQSLHAGPVFTAIAGGDDCPVRRKFVFANAPVKRQLK